MSSSKSSEQLPPPGCAPYPNHGVEPGPVLEEHTRTVHYLWSDGVPGRAQAARRQPGKAAVALGESNEHSVDRLRIGGIKVRIVRQPMLHAGVHVCHKGGCSSLCERQHVRAQPATPRKSNSPMHLRRALVAPGATQAQVHPAVGARQVEAVQDGRARVRDRQAVVQADVVLDDHGEVVRPEVRVVRQPVQRALKRVEQLKVFLLHWVGEVDALVVVVLCEHLLGHVGGGLWRHHAFRRDVQRGQHVAHMLPALLNAAYDIGRRGPELLYVCPPGIFEECLAAACASARAQQARTSAVVVPRG